MSRILWLFLVSIICLPVAYLALGYDVPIWKNSTGKARPLSVPTGDIEMAWMHTSTNGTTWERFVAGLMRVPPGDIMVDDSQAYSSEPEVVLSSSQIEGKLRIRWYKLTSEVNQKDWITALAQRDPAPMAMIGGGSSDRAGELAFELNRQNQWQGDRPLLFITTATADEYEGKPMLDNYDDYSFRFCFTNHQMAKSVVSFAKYAQLFSPQQPPLIISTSWKDDPFSADLHSGFMEALEGLEKTPTLISRHSIGGQNQPNAQEAQVLTDILKICRDQPNRKIVLILSTVTQTARRLLHVILDHDPGLRERLVVLTGDGIPVNALLRDGEFAWPIQSLPVPLVLFCHNDPVAWDDKPTSSHYSLEQPNSTEDVLHFSEIGKILAKSVLDPKAGLPKNAQELHDRLMRLQPPIFDPSGERKAGTGEYVVMLRPDSTLEVHQRTDGTTWKKQSTFRIDQRKGEAIKLPAGEARP